MPLRTWLEGARPKLPIGGEALLRALVDSTADGVLVTDRQNRILMVNPAFTRITGYTAEEVIGRTPSLWRSDRHRPAFYRRMWTSINTEGFWAGEIYNRNKSGQEFAEHLRIFRVHSEDGGDYVHVGVFTEIARHRRIQTRAAKDIHFDRLTGLPNRARFAQQLRERVGRPDDVTVMVVNFDQFRRVNEQLGHDVADKLLTAFARRLRARLRASDVAARISGDEFALLLPGLLDMRHAEALAGMIQKIAADCGEAALLAMPLTASVGFAAHHACGADPGLEAETVLRNAIAAVDDARRSGLGRIATYSEDTAHRTHARYAQERALRQAVRDGAFELHFQPKVDLRTGAVVGAEALIRWPDGDAAIRSPAVFIPLAEQIGLMPQIGLWTLQEAVLAIRRWQDLGLPPLPISVNLSAVQLGNRQIVECIASILKAVNVDPRLLELEVTETAIATDVPTAVAVLEEIRAMGIRVSLDDFGTGYATLTLLQRLPIDTIKIDRSFVGDMPTSASAEQIVRLVVSLARTLGKEVVAEGVETAEQAEMLVDIACATAQGWRYGRAMPIDDLASFATRHGAAA